MECRFRNSQEICFTMGVFKDIILTFNSTLKHFRRGFLILDIYILNIGRYHFMFYKMEKGIFMLFLSSQKLLVITLHSLKENYTTGI